MNCRTVRVISDFDEFMSLKESWKQLYFNSDHKFPFLKWEWFHIWLETFGFNGTVKIFTLYDGVHLIAVAPMIYHSRKWKSFWLLKINFIADTDLADYMDILVHKDFYGDIPYLLNAIIQPKWSITTLKRIRDDSRIIPIIRNHFMELSSNTDLYENCTSPFIDIKGDWEDYYSGKPQKKLRQEIRTTLNKLDKLGKISFTEANTYTIKNDLIALKSFHLQRQTAKVGNSIFDDPKCEEFLINLSECFINNSWVNVSSIKLNDEVISVAYGFTINDIYFYWIPSFNQEYIRYSLGKLHIKYLIEKAFSNGLEKFDFMIGDERYKTQWANAANVNYECKIYSNGFLSFVDRLKRQIRLFLKAQKNNSKLLQKIWVKVS